LSKTSLFPMEKNFQKRYWGNLPTTLGHAIFTIRALTTKFTGALAQGVGR